MHQRSNQTRGVDSCPRRAILPFRATSWSAKTPGRSEDGVIGREPPQSQCFVEAGNRANGFAAAFRVTGGWDFIQSISSSSSQRTAFGRQSCISIEMTDIRLLRRESSRRRQDRSYSLMVVSVGIGLSRRGSPPHRQVHMSELASTRGLSSIRLTVAMWYIFAETREKILSARFITGG